MNAPVQSVSSDDRLHDGPRLVLLVDDDDAIREILVLILQLQGHQVLSASGGAEALATIRAWKGEPIDVLVTDLAMPGMTGDLLAGEVAEILPAIKVLYISGYAEDDPMVRKLDLRGAGYLKKPISPTVLESAIQSLFVSQPVLS